MRECDMLVAREHRISPETIRNIFTGLNDGLVSTLGAISGYFAAFHNHQTIIFAATLIEATAGSLSMGAGAFVAIDSERETRSLLQQNSEIPAAPAKWDRPLRAAMIVGGSYVAGAAVTAAPLLFGAASSLASWFTAGLAIMAVSFFLASMTGMNLKKRIVVNVCILVATALITSGVGELVQLFWNTNK